MKMKQYYPAYWQRRFSNYDGSAEGVASGYTVKVYAADPGMGTASVVKLTEGGLSSENASRKSNIRGGETYPAGTMFRASASPFSGYEFVRWETNLGSGADVLTGAVVDFKLDRNAVLCARFRKKEESKPDKTLRVNWNGEMGRVTCNSNGFVLDNGSPANSGSITAPAGTSVTLTAEAKDGYRFVRWTGLAVAGNAQKEDSPSVTINMRDASVSAVFAAEGNGGGGGGGGLYTDPTEKPFKLTAGSSLSSGGVMGLLKKWWWVLLIAYLVYKETKGGSK